jgi:hypothetical protein
VVDGLEPDRTYPYQLSIDGQEIASGQVRTWPETAESCSFIVMGDFGNGGPAQRAIADQVARVVEQRAATANPIRFVLSTGDNIYALWGGPVMAGSGAADADWVPRFFGPYERILSSIPFYPVLGNHDGNETERRGDLDAYLDNFFFPGNRPARWYSFGYGGLIDFFALDTTSHTTAGPPAPAWRKGSEQHRWAEAAIRGSNAPWKLAWMHHPIFNAGPGHEKEWNEKRMKHFLDLFGDAGVQAVFHGHEHNFQVSRSNERSRWVRFIVSGAGGELRTGDVRPQMEEHNIEAWSAQRHFLTVDVTKERMSVTPVGTAPVKAVKADGSAFPLPLIVSK